MDDGYPESHGRTVFSTFACGGGSTMGYKLAGYDVLGCLEIDQRIMEVYERNHHPQHAYCEDIRDFRQREDLPEELFALDVLDGSPPCSTFSSAGNREKDWGREKYFREGQKRQRLDDLFGEFIRLAERLNPRVVISENVKGMLAGNAKGYVREIVREFDTAGYAAQVFLLNAASMGVPQRRERVFFIARRQDQGPLTLEFDEPPITYGEFKRDEGGKKLTEHNRKLWDERRSDDRALCDIHQRRGEGRKRFNARFAFDNRPFYTISASGDSRPIRHDIPYRVSVEEMVLGSTFPLDYDFGDMKPGYILGMSVPPVMMAQIASEVREQWFE